MMTFEELVTLIGPGFHPDTRGKDYASLPVSVTAADVDRVVDDAFMERTCEGDVYDRTLNLFHRNGWMNP